MKRSSLRFWRRDTGSTSRPMTPDEEAAFDGVFEEFDGAFAAMGRAFDRMNAAFDRAARTSPGHETSKTVGKAEGE